MKKKHRIVAAVSAAAVAASALAWSAFANEAPVLEVEEGALLGAATHFHLFGNEIFLQSHVHGNVAANYLNSHSRDYGVRPGNLDGLSSINYIKDFYDGLNADSLSTKLVVGSDVTVGSFDNGNGVTLTSPSGGYAELRYDKIGELVKEDPDTPYIDIEAELASFAEMSENIATMGNSDGISFSCDTNNINIDCSGASDKFLYYTLDLANPDVYNAITGNAQIHIKNVNFEEGQFLYLTVDTSSYTDLTFTKSWNVYKYGTDEAYPHGELPLSQGGGRILYNLVSDGSAFTGKITLGEVKLGSFLVPKGEVDASGNVCGTIVANKIVCTGESHRWDVQIEGTYDASDKNPDLDPDDPDPVVTTTTTQATTTTPAPVTTTTPAPTTTTKVTTTTPAATTTTQVTTTTPAATTTSQVTTTTPAATTTTDVTTTTPAATTTTDVTTTTPAATTTTDVTTTTPVATTTTDVTTTTPAATTTTDVTTTTAAPAATTTVTTTANVAGDDNSRTTTTTTAPANVAGDDDSKTTTTTAPADVAGDNDSKNTTTTTVTTVPTIDDIKDEFDDIPDDITTDEEVEKIKEIIDKIDYILENDDTLTDAQIDELKTMRKVLGEKVEAYTAGDNDNTANTGFKAGISLAVMASATLIFAAFAGRKKTLDEDDD